MNSNVSSLIKYYRESNSYTQTKVAQYLGISAPAYNHYETGNREPNIEVLTKLAKLYNLEDQILGVCKPNNTMKNPLTNYTMKEIHENIGLNSTKYSLSSKYNNKKVSLLSSQFDAICKYFSENPDDKQNIFKDIASSIAGNDGKLYEALTYAWLEHRGIQFDTQRPINAEECLKKHNYIADGVIFDTVVFDVKQFGIAHPNITRLQLKLNEMCKEKNPDYYITISGSLDLSNSVLQKLLSDVPGLYSNIFKDNNRLSTDYSYHILNTGLSVRATLTKAHKIIVSTSEINPYKWAAENQFYFFHDASQFCVDQPFVIICPYDGKTAPFFTNVFTNSTMVAFRSLCRRMFLGMPDDVEVKDFDSNCYSLVSLKTASTCISAVLFIDISMQSEYDDTWLFINPNARNQMPESIIDMISIGYQCMVDNYFYDNY